MPIMYVPTHTALSNALKSEPIRGIAVDTIVLIRRMPIYICVRYSLEEISVYQDIAHSITELINTYQVMWGTVLDQG